MLKKYTEAFYVLEKVVNVPEEEKKAFDQLRNEVDQELKKIYQEEELNRQKFNEMDKITEYQGQLRVELQRKQIYYEQLCRRLLSGTDYNFESIIKQLDPILKPLKNLPMNITQKVLYLFTPTLKFFISRNVKISLQNTKQGIVPTIVSIGTNNYNPYKKKFRNAVERCCSSFLPSF